MKNRIVDYKLVKASELQANPNNWRTHPDGQRKSVAAVLDEVGWVDAVIFNQRTGRLVDGHLRQDIAGDELVPVLVVDLSESEERKVLATFDPLTAMAGIDAYKLDELLRELETDSADLQAMLDDMQVDVDELLRDLNTPTTPPSANGHHAKIYSDDEIIEDAFQYFRVAGFPYRHLEPFECKQEINRLASLENDALINTKVAHHVADTYHKHRFHAHAIGMKSPYEAFCDDDRLRKAIRFELENGKVDTGYINALTTISTTQAAANFRPGFALYYYRKFNVDNGVVLDTSTGYGGRLVGFMASAFERYIGIDPNTETHSANLEMCDDLGISNRVELYNVPAEDMAIDKLKCRCDFAFTSPPYFKKEIYSHDETQSWKRYDDIEGWITGFLLPMFQLQFSSLKDGCYSVVNIANVRIGSKEYELVKPAIECSVKAGFKYIGKDEFPLASRFGLGHGDEVATEPVLIFQRQ